MQMRPELQIQSMVKALTDVVLPAVDASNKLAHEQARLVIGTLGLMATQLPLQFRFDCDELVHLLELARELQRLTSGDHAVGVDCQELAARTVKAAAVLERAQADPREILESVRHLRAASSAVVSQVFREGDTVTQDRVQKTVLAASKAQLLRDRSWVLAQGWEPDPKSVPCITTLIGESPSRELPT